MPDAKGELPYGALVKPIVKHDMSFMIGLRDDDLKELAKEVANSKVYLKATKQSKLKTLKDWYNDVKVDRVLMNKITLKYKNNPLPSKSFDYKKYNEEEWLDSGGASGVWIHKGGHFKFLSRDPKDPYWQRLDGSLWTCTTFD